MEAMASNCSGSLRLSGAAAATADKATSSEVAIIAHFLHKAKNRTIYAKKNLHLLPVRQNNQPQGSTSERMVQRHGQQGRGQTLRHDKNLRLF